MSLSFRTKLFSSLILAWFCPLSLKAYDLISVDTQRLEERKNPLMKVSDLAYSIAKEYEALARIKDFRYGHKGYVTVTDLHPTVLMHPIKPELKGKDVSQ